MFLTEYVYLTYDFHIEPRALIVHIITQFSITMHVILLSLLMSTWWSNGHIVIFLLTTINNWQFHYILKKPRTVVPQPTLQNGGTQISAVVTVAGPNILQHYTVLIVTTTYILYVSNHHSVSAILLTQSYFVDICCFIYVEIYVSKTIVTTKLKLKNLY